MNFSKYNHTSVSDISLFKKLGLKPFENLSSVKTYVGEYKLPESKNGLIKINVVCMPAQFWEFEIETVDGDLLKIETGSGDLSTFWPSILLIAQGMIGIKAE